MAQRRKERIGRAIASGSVVAGAMIRVAGKDCQRPIELLDDENAHDLVRQSERSEGDDEIGPLPHPGVEPVRSADGARESRPALIAPAREALGE